MFSTPVFIFYLFIYSLGDPGQDISTPKALPPCTKETDTVFLLAM